MSTEITVKEGYEAAKTVCSGVKWIVSSFKRDGIIRKNEIKILQDDLRAITAAKKMQNGAQLFALSMNKIDEFIKHYDVDNMNTEEAKIFHSKLEKLSDYLDNILSDYSKGIV